MFSKTVDMETRDKNGKWQDPKLLYTKIKSCLILFFLLCLLPLPGTHLLSSYMIYFYSA